MHICVSRLTIIGSDNGLSPGRRQAIIWTNAGILFIGPKGTHFSEVLIGIQTCSFMKMRLNVSSAKWRPFCLGLNELKCGVYVIQGLTIWRGDNEKFQELRILRNSLGSHDSIRYNLSEPRLLAIKCKSPARLFTVLKQWQQQWINLVRHGSHVHWPISIKICDPLLNFDHVDNAVTLSPKKYQESYDYKILHKPWQLCFHEMR